MLATLWQDVRHGGRMLVKNPGFALIAIASIGIGVGANAAMFSLADGLLLRPLGIPRPGEVLSIVGTSPERGVFPPALSYPDYVDIRERARTFESLAAFRNVLTDSTLDPTSPRRARSGARSTADSSRRWVSVRPQDASFALTRTSFPDATPSSCSTTARGVTGSASTRRSSDAAFA